MGSQKKKGERGKLKRKRFRRLKGSHSEREPRGRQGSSHDSMKRNRAQRGGEAEKKKSAASDKKIKRQTPTKYPQKK